MLLELLEVGCG